MSQLQLFAPQVWVVQQDHRMMGLALGARMTIVEVGEGALWVHSPIALSPALKAEVDALGSVQTIIAPNRFHHVYAGDWAKAYPEARFIGAAGLATKRKDLSFTQVLGADLSFEGFRHQHIGGCMLDETVFLHEASGTLISCDLFENFTTCDHGLTRLYLQMGGVYGRPGLHPIIRLVYRDRKAARVDVAKVLEWDFDRVVISHGACVSESARSKSEAGLAWLMA